MPVPLWEYVNELRHGKHKINSDNVISGKGSVEHFDYSLVLRTSNSSIDASDKRLGDYNNDMAKEKEKAKAASAERWRKMGVAKKNIKEEFSNFFKETSFTALVQIYKAKSFWRRVAWTVLVLGMLTWLSIQCFWLVERYFSYQMEVKLDMQATTELEFPSVTICNLNPIRVSSTNQYPYTDLQQYVKPDTSDMLYSETLRTWEFDGQCPPDEVQCSNGQCISPYSMCDGINDCYNNYDEENCGDYICPNGTWKCPSGVCLDITGRCDGVMDCSDGADEVDCSSNVCPSNYTRCTSGKCIVMSWLCDGYVDCPDAEDENNCPDVSCSSAEFKCSTVNICIPGTYACDGMDDCSDGSDESGCASYSCLPTHVKCNTSHLCIQKAWICDTINDCGDNEDESKCYIPGSGSGSGSSTVGYYGSSTQSGSGSFTPTPATSTMGTLGSPTQQTIGSTTQQATHAPTQQPTASPTQQPTGSPTQQTIASPTQQTVGSTTQQATGAPTQQTIASPTQQTVGSTTQQATGPTTQQTIASPTQQPTVPTTQQPGVPTTVQPGGFPKTTTQGLPSTDPLNNPTTTTTSATGGSTISGTTNIGQSTPSPLASSSTMSTSTAFAGRRRKRSVVEANIGSDGGTHTHLEERKWSHYSAARLRHEEYHQQIENKIARHRDEWVKNKAKKLKDQRIKEIQDDYIKYLGNKFRQEEEDSATTQKKSKRRREEPHVLPRQREHPRQSTGMHYCLTLPSISGTC